MTTAAISAREQRSRGKTVPLIMTAFWVCTVVVAFVFVSSGLMYAMGHYKNGEVRPLLTGTG